MRIAVVPLGEVVALVGGGGDDGVVALAVGAAATHRAHGGIGREDGDGVLRGGDKLKGGDVGDVGGHGDSARVGGDAVVPMGEAVAAGGQSLEGYGGGTIIGAAAGDGAPSIVVAEGGDGILRGRQGCALCHNGEVVDEEVAAADGEVVEDDARGVALAEGEVIGTEGEVGVGDGVVDPYGVDTEGVDLVIEGGGTVGTDLIGNDIVAGTGDVGRDEVVALVVGVVGVGDAESAGAVDTDAGKEEPAVEALGSGILIGVVDNPAVDTVDGVEVVAIGHIDNAGVKFLEESDEGGVGGHADGARIVGTAVLPL